MAFSREDVIWAAGILEGEDSFSLNRNQNKGKNTYPRIQCGMTDFDIIDRLKGVFEVGNITFVERPSPYKDKMIWAVTKKQHVQAVCVAIWPWMGHRRRTRIVEILEFV